MTGKTNRLLQGLTVILALAFIPGCGNIGGSGGGTTPPTQPAAPGSVVAFGTDAPACDVESFVVTITSASLVPQNGGTAVPLITASAPATVDFARLANFTNVLSVTNNIPVGTYSQLQVSLSNPQLVMLNTSTNPPSAQTVTVSLQSTTATVNISPALVVTTGGTSGLGVEVNLLKSLQVDNNGQVTGTVDPQFSVAANAQTGSWIGAEDAVYGVVQSVSTSNVPSGFTGSFTLAVPDGTGQTLTFLTTSNTVFEGDGVPQFSDLTPNTFAEVSGTVSVSGQFIAEDVNSEEQVSTTSQRSAFLGRITSVSRIGLGNATSFTLLVDSEVPDLSSTVPLASTLNVTLQGSVQYFTNDQNWNTQGFVYGPQSVGVGQKVAVFGVLQAGSTLAADHIFLRPQSLWGNFATLLKAGSDNFTGGFTMLPCGGLFGGQSVTVVTTSNSVFTGVSGLNALTTAPTLNATGILSYLLASGTASTGAPWVAPTWVMQAIGVHQLPD